MHAAHINPGSRLAGMVNSTALRVNSLHHQAIDRVAEGQTVLARAPDDVIEGVESTMPTWWMVGVQWHPEELIGSTEAWDRLLFATFAHAMEFAAINSPGATAPRS